MPAPHVTPETIWRGHAMFAAYVGGQTYREIARAYGLSPTRCRQLVERENRRRKRAGEPYLDLFSRALVPHPSGKEG